MNDKELIMDLTLFSKDNNRFCAIFFKLLKGIATNEEIEFAKKYAKEYGYTKNQ